MKKERISIVAAVSFFFASFSFFEAGCGNVKKSTADRALATNTRPNHMMVDGRRSSQGEVRKGMHTQMLSFEDSTIRDAVFPERSEKRKINNEQAREHGGMGWPGLGR
jgi:hypothetical protein